MDLHVVWRIRFAAWWIGCTTWLNDLQPEWHICHLMFQNDCLWTKMQLLWSDVQSDRFTLQSLLKNALPYQLTWCQIDQIWRMIGPILLSSVHANYLYICRRCRRVIKCTDYQTSLKQQLVAVMQARRVLFAEPIGGDRTGWTPGETWRSSVIPRGEQIFCHGLIVEKLHVVESRLGKRVPWTTYKAADLFVWKKCSVQSSKDPRWSIYCWYMRLFT